MNPKILLEAGEYTFEGPEVTWAGPHPFAPGLCFGFEDGSLRFLGEKGLGQHQQVSPAREAINGVASVGSHSLAVSTRADITFIEMDDHSRCTYESGSHGVVATPSGYFIAPLGPSGLLAVRPEKGASQSMMVTDTTEDRLYFYRMAVVHDGDGKEVLVFANRRQGVGISDFPGDGKRRRIHTQTFEGLDVVDVCAVRDGTLSAVAISPKAEVVLFRDVTSKHRPLSVRLGGIQGSVYRVLCLAGRLYVLSSTALYIWSDFVAGAQRGVSASAIPPIVFPMQAVDMSICTGEYLVIVMAANQVQAVRLDDLPAAKRAARHEKSNGLSEELAQAVKVESFEPRWLEDDVEQGIMAHAG